ncbi:TPA: hypothetical protein R2A51_001316 [Campylobacter jejuni]|uniref:Uncharacterized protein n=2 Tax=Campylobacter TaxID=194 RepID=A0A5T1B658_CAMJU|nr:hypothetical protein [Campylobacter jejuni]EAI7674757.1 hypothetical protein [Campylobacter coli]EAH4617284.1 hypothetical protein [Campylobacter jejuni]EAH6881447.1 hypothetical protein [Campylobacter jejuni]EAH7561074.1 hypothetical protein [Campylobacter jejuni]EAH9955232.1 hypothetical protein [Campylobacter jejuni]
MKGIISGVCAIALLVSANTLNADYNEKLSIETKNTQFALKTIKTEDYISLCSEVVKLNRWAFYTSLCDQNYFLTLEGKNKIKEKQKIRKIIKQLNKTITTSKKRMNDKNFTRFEDADLKVYYSSLATKNILETILDEDFIKVTGGFDTSLFKEDFDIVEYGKGIEAVYKNITNEEKQEFALIRERAKEYECLFQI